MDWASDIRAVLLKSGLFNKIEELMNPVLSLQVHQIAVDLMDYFIDEIEILKLPQVESLVLFAKRPLPSIFHLKQACVFIKQMTRKQPVHIAIRAIDGVLNQLV